MEDYRIRENSFIANVIASKANAAGLSNRQVLDTSGRHEMLKRYVASRKIGIDGLKKFAKGFKLNTPVPADVLPFLGKVTATQAPATVSAPSPSCHSFMEQLCQAEHRHWTVRKSGSRPLWSDTLHARFLSLDTKESVKLQVSPKNEVSIPVAKLAPWDVLYVEGIAGCCLDGLVARNSAPLFNEAEIKDLTRSATRG